MYRHAHRVSDPMGRMPLQGCDLPFQVLPCIVLQYQRSVRAAHRQPHVLS